MAGKQRKAASAGAPRPNFFVRAARYLGEVRMELRKTTFPDKPELIASTQVVLGLVVMVGIFIYLLDLVLYRVAVLLQLAPGS